MASHDTLELLGSGSNELPNVATRYSHMLDSLLAESYSNDGPHKSKARQQRTRSEPRGSRNMSPSKKKKRASSRSKVVATTIDEVEAEVQQTPSQEAAELYLKALRQKVEESKPGISSGAATESRSVSVPVARHSSPLKKVRFPSQAGKDAIESLSSYSEDKKTTDTTDSDYEQLYLKALRDLGAEKKQRKRREKNLIRLAQELHRKATQVNELESELGNKSVKPVTAEELLTEAMMSKHHFAEDEHRQESPSKSRRSTVASVEREAAVNEAIDEGGRHRPHTTVSEREGAAKETVDEKEQSFLEMKQKKLEKVRQTKTSAMQHLQCRMNAVKGNVDGLATSLDDKTSKIFDLEQVVARLSKEVKVRADQMADWEKAIKSKDRTLIDNERHINELQKEIARLRYSLRESTDALDRTLPHKAITEALSGVQQQHAEEIKEVHRQLAERTEECTRQQLLLKRAKEVSRSKMNELAQKHEVEVERLKEDHVSRIRDIMDLTQSQKEQITCLQADLEKARASPFLPTAAVDTRIKQGEDAVAALSEEVTEKAVTIEELEQTVKMQDDQIRGLELSLEEITDKVKENKAAFESCSTEIAAKHMEELTQLHKDIQERDDEIEKLMADLEARKAGWAPDGEDHNALRVAESFETAEIYHSGSATMDDDGVAKYGKPTFVLLEPTRFLRKRLESLEQEVVAAQSVIQGHEDTIEKLESHVTERDERICDLEGSLVAVENEKATIEQETAFLTKRLEESLQKEKAKEMEEEINELDFDNVMTAIEKAVSDETGEQQCRDISSGGDLDSAPESNKKPETLNDTKCQQTPCSVKESEPSELAGVEEETTTEKRSLYLREQGGDTQEELPDVIEKVVSIEGDEGDKSQVYKEPTLIQVAESSRKKPSLRNWPRLILKLVATTIVAAYCLLVFRAFSYRMATNETISWCAPVAPHGTTTLIVGGTSSVVSPQSWWMTQTNHIVSWATPSTLKPWLSSTGAGEHKRILMDWLDDQLCASFRKTDMPTVVEWKGDELEAFENSIKNGNDRLLWQERTAEPERVVKIRNSPWLSEEESLHGESGTR